MSWQNLQSTLQSWAAKRPVTTSLTGLLLLWYLFELFVLHTYGAQIAEAWFYWSKPTTLPPQPALNEVILAPISHDLYTPTHIVGNVAGLLVVGGYAEPRIGSDDVASLVIGVNYLGIVVANYTAFLHKNWMLAGISGGLLALTAYTGLNSRHQFRELLEHRADVRETIRSKPVRERFIGGVLCLSIPGLLFLEPLLVGFNSGHATGIILGVLIHPFLSEGETPIPITTLAI